MSYEGYTQNICANGHYFEADDSGPNDGSQAVCIICKSRTAWHNRVDDTNCERVGYIPFSVLTDNFSITPSQECNCQCGHKHYSPHIFRIPTVEETNPMRTIHVQYSKTPVLISELEVKQ